MSHDAAGAPAPTNGAFGADGGDVGASVAHDPYKFASTSSDESEDEGSVASDAESDDDSVLHASPLKNERSTMHCVQSMGTAIQSNGWV